MNIFSFFLDVCICPQINSFNIKFWYCLLNCYTSVLVHLLFVFICGMQVFSPEGHNESIIYRNHVSHTTSAFFLLIIMNQEGYVWHMSMPEPLEKYSHTPFSPLCQNNSETLGFTKHIIALTW